MKRNPTTLQHVPARFDPVTGKCWLWHWPTREWHRATNADGWNPLNHSYSLWLPDSDEKPELPPVEYSIVPPLYEIKPIVRTAQGYLAGDPGAFAEASPQSSVLGHIEAELVAGFGGQRPAWAADLLEYINRAKGRADIPGK